MSGELGVVSTLEVVGAKFVVRDLILQDVVCGGQDGRGDGEDRLLGSSPTLETKELRAQVRVAGAGGDPRDLDERGFEPRVAGSGPSGEPLAGTFLLAGAEAGPGIRWPAVGNRLMSNPISATMTRATVHPTAGIVITRSTAA